MSQGIAAVTQGMSVAEKITANIGTDLANSDTDGYKGFDNFMVSETNKYTGGVSVTSKTKVDIQGNVKKTGLEFDYRIQGKSMFAVECNGKRRFTNAGKFKPDKQGYLRNPNGCYLLGEKYGINDKKSKESIDSTGATFEKIKVPLNEYIRGEQSTKATVSANLSATKDLTANYASKDMADGKKTPDFLRPFSIYDSVDKMHTLNVGFIKIEEAKYTVEIYTADQADKLVASGAIEFNNDGTQKSVAEGLKNLTMNWNNSLAGTTSITMNWDDIKMYGKEFTGDVEIDGKAGGVLEKTSIDEKGNLVGHAGESSELIAAIPVVLFKAPSELEQENGTVFSSNAKSGNPEYVLSGSGGAGEIKQGELEGPNVNATTSMTELMIQQRFNGYNTKAFGVMNGIENDLLGMIRV